MPATPHPRQGLECGVTSPQTHELRQEGELSSEDQVQFLQDGAVSLEGVQELVTRRAAHRTGISETLEGVAGSVQNNSRRFGIHFWMLPPPRTICL